MDFEQHNQVEEKHSKNFFCLVEKKESYTEINFLWNAAVDRSLFIHIKWVVIVDLNDLKKGKKEALEQS